MTVILTFLAQHWRIFVVAGLIATNAASCGLWRHEAKKVTTLENSIKLAEAAAENRAKEQDEITKETSDAWASAVDYLRANPQRVLSRFCQPGIPQPAAGADGSGQGAVLTAAGVEEDAAAAVLQLNRLQDWIEKQKAVK